MRYYNYIYSSLAYTGIQYMASRSEQFDNLQMSSSASAAALSSSDAPRPSTTTAVPMAVQPRQSTSKVLTAEQQKAQRELEKEKSDRAAKKMEAMARGRQKFEYNGRTVYEWDQSLEEVRLYVRPPPGVQARDIQCKISSTHLSLGLKGAAKPFIDEEFFSKVKVDESDWMMSDGEIEINCQKMNKAQTWESALLGHGQMNPYVKGEVQKALMLERFGAENPGFDFSGAEFSGSVPDPRNFMGGVKYE